MLNRDIEPTTNHFVPSRPSTVGDVCRALARQVRDDAPAVIRGRERWTEYREVNDPGSGKKLPNEGHAADEWDSYATVNDPASGKQVPNEGHAADEWDSYATVNDPASGKQVPNEGHAADEWDSYATVNDPASGKQIPNEGHAAQLRKRFEPPLLLTDTFVQQTEEIYAGFVPTDLEYPALGVTIAGAPVFVECLRYPDAAIVRRQFTDEVRGDHPELTALWNATLVRHTGKCRYCSVHIHPMDLSNPSSVDITNYERVRTDTRAPNTFGPDEPFPFILINLHDGALQLLGFVVENGACRAVPVERVRDDDPRVTAAWDRAMPLPYFRAEAKIADYIREHLSPVWSVRFGTKPGEERTAVLAEHQDGRRLIVRFDPFGVLGLGHALLESRDVLIEKYIDWGRLFTDLASPPAPPVAAQAVEIPHTIANGSGHGGTSTAGAATAPNLASRSKPVKARHRVPASNGHQVPRGTASKSTTQPRTNAQNARRSK